MLLPSFSRATGGVGEHVNHHKVIGRPLNRSPVNPTSLKRYHAASHALDRFALIIPSNRSTAVRAALDFHSALGVPTVAAVTPDLQDVSSPPGTTVVVADDYAERVLAALGQTDAEYVMTIGDDDFVYPNGVAAAVRRLTESPEVAAVDGHRFDLHRRSGQYAATAISTTCAPTPDVLTRFFDFNAGVCSFANIVRRRDDVHAAVTVFRTSGLDFPFLEILLDYSGLVAGPTIQVPEMTLVRSRVQTDTAGPNSWSPVPFLETLIDVETNGLKTIVESFRRFHELRSIRWDPGFARRMLTLYLSANATGGRRRTISTVRLNWLAEKASQSYALQRTLNGDRLDFVQHVSEFHQVRYP